MPMESESARKYHQEPRHTFATQMLEAGVPIEDIKEMLGHDDETETCIYIHVTLDAAKKLLENHIGNPQR